MQSNNTIIYNGEFIDAAKPVIRAESRGLMYGDGCFETFKCYSGKFLHIEKHLERFEKGADFLGIEFPSFFNPEILKRNVRTLLSRNELTGSESVIRLQLCRDGRRGYGLTHSENIHFSVVASGLPALKDHIMLSVAKTRRIPQQALPSEFKLSNNINYISARREADNENADDALMLTIDETVAETTIANIFWVRQGTVFTPSADCDILPGVTRKLVISLCENQLGREVLEGRYPLSELKEAETVWVCNSIREVTPVSLIDGTKYNIDHPILTSVQKAFKKYREINLT